MIRFILEKSFNIIFLAFSIIIFSAAVLKCAESLGIFAVLIVIPVLVAVYFFTKKIEFKKSETYKHVWIVARVVSAAVMIYLMCKLAVGIKNTWDWGALIAYAHQYITKGKIRKPEYFAQYPNNFPWFTIVHAVATISRLIYPKLTMVMLRVITNCLSFVLVQATISLIYRAAKRYWGERKAFFVGVMALLYLPLYLHAQFFYTDIPTMFLVSFAFYLMVRILKSDSKRNVYILCACLGAVIAVAMLIKITAVIVIVAVILAMALSKVRFKQLFAMTLSMILTISCVYLPADRICKKHNYEILNISEEMAKEKEFPYTHWIMMGLGCGYYSQEDVDFTASFGSVEEKKQANIEEIKNRVEKYGFNGLVWHLYYKKLGNTFGNSCLNGDHYVSRDPLFENFETRIFSKDGDLHKSCLYYSWTVHLSLLLGVVFSAVAASKKKRTFENKGLLFARLSFFGFGLFMMIWECNSRYLLMFVPIMLALSADGYISLFSSIDRLLKRRKK